MIEAIQKRRSIRRYQDIEVEKEKIRELLLSAMCAPSGYHRNPWEFVVVKKQTTRETLSLATNYASFVKESPVVIIIAADESNSFRWIEDCSVAAAHIYLEATNQGLGTCWVQVHGMQTPEGTDSEDYVRKIVNIPNDHRILCMMSIGYPAEDLPEHDDKKYDPKKVHTEKW